MQTNLFSRWTTRLIAALMIALLALAAMPALPAQAGPLEVISTIAIDVGTAQSKTTGTTLTITTTSAVTAGDDIIVTFVMDNAAGTVSVSDSVGNTYTSYADVTNANGVRTVIFAAFHVTALPNGSTITIAHPSVTARAATAGNFRGLAPSGVFDRSSTGTGHSADPSSGATALTNQADELLIGAIGTEGPSGDNAGAWQNSFIAGPRVGTIGSPAASNITISMGYRIVNATGTYTVAKTGIAIRDWAAAIATFRMDISVPTVIIDQAAGQPDPTTVSPINFTITFSERVTGFATGDVSFAGSTAGGTLVGTVTEIAPNDGTTYNVAVTGMTSSGTVMASIPTGRATDIGGNNNTASTSVDNTVTYNVIAPPNITSVPPAGGTVNNAYSHTYTATGTAPIMFSLTAGGFPPGLSLTPAGVLSGTPTTAGTYTGTVTATNGIAPDDTQDFSIFVSSANTTTTIVNHAPDPSVVGEAVTVTFTVTGQFGNTPTVPTGDVEVTDGVDSCTGTVAAGSCDITLTTAGSRTLTATYAGDADFSGSTSAGETHTVNSSPAFLSADNTTFTVGSVSIFTINASGYPAPAISHTSGALPTGILFTPGVGSATLSGTPDPGTAGVYTLTFEAANGILPDATQTFTLTIAGGPTIVTNGVNTLADTGDGHLDEGETVAVGLSQILVTFNKDVNNPTPDPVPPDPDDVTNPANYLLVSDNGDGIQTFTCDTTAPGGGVTGGDTPISVDSVIYTNNGGLGPFLATLNINGGTALPDGTYRLIVCGTTSIVDLGGLPLAGNSTLEGTDFTRNFRVAIAGTGGGGGGGGGRGGGGGGSASGALIPVTGFAPGRVTDLSHLPATGYHATGDATLEIPALKLKMPIVGIPFKDNTWDVNWLLNQAGWLEGSAFPGFNGNSVLTSHVTLPYGQPGPFADLHKLKVGDKIFVRAFGYLYVYEIKSVSKASASDPSILQHEDDAWLTLVTCADYNEIVETYLKRLVVKARLVQTQTDILWHVGR
ncbi:MAG: sortase [Chloroflexota bacterium]